jgi:hypothetical protein
MRLDERVVSRVSLRAAGAKGLAAVKLVN